MAPSARGARGRGASTRGRGGHVSRSRGGRNGQASSRTPSGPKSAFYSTRVEELPEDVSENDQVSTLEESDQDVELYGSSEDNEENTVSITTKPYTTLLQSLAANAPSNEPARKKRKLSPKRGLGEPRAITSPAIAAAALQDDLDLDHVEEPPEDDEQSAEDLDDADATDDIISPHDNFEVHFRAVNEKVLASCIADCGDSKWKAQRTVLQSGWKVSTSSYHNSPDNFGLRSGKGPTATPDFQLKQKLEAKAIATIPDNGGLNELLGVPIFSYQDVLFCDRTPAIAEHIRALSCLHALNHVLKTRDHVIKNNARLSKSGIPDDTEYRDQGFTRPKALILLPTRQACVKAVDTIVSFYDPEQQENRKRFQDSYSQTADEFSDDKPADFRELFGGNDDDMFRLGIKFTRKTIKYFSQFYNSDIIIASPLGLRMAIGTDDTKKKDHDFLSSIEIVVVDQAEALLMQNWEHVEYIFEHLNLQPKETHGCDFSRVHNWYLDGHARYLRQTVFFTAFNTPELNRIYGHYMLNIAGKVKISKSEYNGAMLDMSIQVKQTFSRYESPELPADPDARFKYFTTAVVPILTKASRTLSGKGQGTLIFIPSYMDFVRVRNFLATSSSTQNISFGSISEYTPVRDVARARSHFFSGRHSVLLYTGRAHHFRRYILRGVRKIVMYALPDNPIFYQDFVEGFLMKGIADGSTDPSQASVRSIFSKWDFLKLERVVGTRRCTAMLKEKGGDTFDFL
ncbi:rRNA-binding ribosome biosynthesis protein utp25 [Lambiella insularis]|nr:rRNA-binding ribosome biosynthesis protein utp25 [Lambiella insularis]